MNLQKKAYSWFDWQMWGMCRHGVKEWSSRWSTSTEKVTLKKPGTTGSTCLSICLKDPATAILTCSQRCAALHKVFTHCIFYFIIKAVFSRLTRVSLLSWWWVDCRNCRKYKAIRWLFTAWKTPSSRFSKLNICTSTSEAQGQLCCVCCRNCGNWSCFMNLRHRHGEVTLNELKY